MDSQSQTSPAAAPINWKKLVVPALLALAVACYANLLVRHMAAYAAGADSSGYLNSAKMISAGKARIQERVLSDFPADRASRHLYVPFGFRPVDGGVMVPTYPTGMPLLFAAASTVTGWEGAAPWTIGLHALAGVGLCYLLGRAFGLRREWAAVGAMLLATSPLYLLYSIQTLSDMPALVWTTAAILLTWTATKENKQTVLVVAGIVFAMAVLVRPSNFLAIAPIAVVLGRDWRRWLLLGLGGLPGVVFLALYNHSAYGEIFASGYDGVGGLLKPGWVLETFAHYGKWLPLLLAPLIAAVLGLPWLPRAAPKIVTVLAVWIAVFLGFYSLYWFTHETWWALRFILPAVPALLVGSLLVVQHACNRFSKETTRLTVIAAIAAAVFAWNFEWTKRLNIWVFGTNEEAYREALDWAVKNLPGDAVVLGSYTSGTMLFYSDFTIIRADQIQPSDAAGINASLAASGKPLYAILFPMEEDDVLHNRMPGDWEKIGTAHHISIWRRNPARPATTRG